MRVRCMRSAAGLLTLALAGLALPAGATNYLVSGIVVDSQSHAPLGNVRVSWRRGPRATGSWSGLPNRMADSRSR